MKILIYKQLEGKTAFESYHQIRQFLARKFLVSLDKAVTETNSFNIIEDAINTATNTFLAEFVKCVTAKVIEIL